MMKNPEAIDLAGNPYAFYLQPGLGLVDNMPAEL